MSSADINLVVEPWTTANTQFNLNVENRGNPDEALMVEFAGEKFALNGENIFIKLKFKGDYENNIGKQAACLIFNLVTPGYSFQKRDNGIKNHSNIDKFGLGLDLQHQDRCIVTISSVDIEQTGFSFNFDIVNNNGGRDHLFDPDIDIIRPPQ